LNFQPFLNIICIKIIITRSCFKTKERL